MADNETPKRLGDLPEIRIQDLTACAHCRGKLAAPNPQFYRLSVEMCLLDVRALNQRLGLSQMWGGGAAAFNVAGVFTSDTAARVVSKTTVLVCANCFHEGVDPCILAEVARENEAREQATAETDAGTDMQPSHDGESG